MKKISFLAILAIALAGCTGAPTDGDGTFKVGVISPLSGGAAQYGLEQQRVFDYTLDQINAGGGYRGTDVELVYEDGKCSGSDAVTAFQKLVDIDEVDVVTTLCSSESLAIAPLTESSQVLAVSATSSNPDIEGASSFLYSLSYSDDLIGGAMLEQLKGFKSVAIISEQNDYNIGLKNIFEAALGDAVVASEMFEPTMTDFRNIIEKVSNAGVEAIVLNPFAGTTATNLIKQMAESAADFEDTQLVSHIAYLADETREGVAELAEGMIIVDVPKMTSDDIMQFQANVEQKHGGVSNFGGFFVATTHDTLVNLVELANEVGEDSVALRDALVADELVGFVAGGLSLGTNNFLKGVQAAVYVVTEGVAEIQ
ncbi:ABC transporter substrate-binding protein [bacterium]|jgi:branched-chain amino acid transport system substrate-binding protein|nr:ABC transporter substrate-binding protein [bacterium]